MLLEQINTLLYKYGITNTGSFSFEEIEAGASFGKLRTATNNNEKLLAMLKTMKNGELTTQKDYRLSKYSNPAFWYLLANTRIYKFGKSLFSTLIKDLSKSDAEFAEGHQEISRVVQFNLLSKIPFLLIKKPEYIMDYIKIFAQTSNLYNNTQTSNVTDMINVLIIANVIIDATALIDLTINFYGENIKLVSDMKTYAFENGLVVKNCLCFLFKSQVMNHKNESYIYLKPNDIYSKKICSKVKCYNATERCDIIRQQLYSAYMC